MLVSVSKTKVPNLESFLQIILLGHYSRNTQAWKKMSNKIVLRQKSKNYVSPEIFLMSW